MFPVDLVRHDNAELFIAIVAPVGADADAVCNTLEESLRRFDYKMSTVRVVEQLKQFSGYIEEDTETEYARIKGRMDAGDKFRKELNRNDALALLAVTEIQKIRSQANSSGRPIPRMAYLFRSLKRPEEVTALRRIYASNFIALAVHAGREQRVRNLSARISRAEYSTQSTNYRDKAEELVLRDESDETKLHGQKLRDAFALSDVFVDAGSPKRLEEDLNRFLELLFAKPVITPTRDEVGMAHAYLAAMRSAEMGRQVGAAICDPKGNLIALGTNEVPKAHGGTYWDGDNPDARDWARGFDSSDHYKSSSLGELLKTLSDKSLLSEELLALSVPEQIEKIRPVLKATRYMQLIEFVRAVHGEMSALTDAASRGVAVTGGTLFVTAFPCHECARHIIAAGIRRVVYIDPYSKSLALELHADSIELDSAEDPSKIPFVPFLGISPRNHANMFGMSKRKGPDGKVLVWQPSNANPRVSGSFWAYLNYESEDLNALTKHLEKAGLTLM
jgi:cytidine deaminase